MSTNIIIAIVLAAFALIIVVSCYNKGIVLRNYIKEAFATMDVYLKKRWDLVPNLITIAKAYATHEKDLFSNVTKIRSGNYESMTLEQKLQTNKELASGLNKMFVAIENYPEIKADKHFMELMVQLPQIEDDIANSRKYYNGCVRVYNNYCEIFPTSLFAMIFGFKSEKMFEAGSIERENIKVNF